MTLATPDQILDYWMADASRSPEALESRHKMWFGKSPDLDAEIRERFSPTVDALRHGLALEWAKRGARIRLAAIIALDQFTRNMHRDTPAAFSGDMVARALTKDGVLAMEDEDLSEVEQTFYYLPLEHSEALIDQNLCVDLLQTVTKTARPAFKSYVERSLEYAIRHRDVIAKFGRFPHRNAILGRTNTPEEAKYLASPGAGF